jgi:hypothetical protein
MTKTHFEAIASIIDSNRDATFGEAREAVSQVAQDMATYFATQNPRFDSEKFLTACGLMD